MTFTEEQIERIVAEVIWRLTVAVGREANHDTAAPAKEAELRIADRVVTMRTIESRLSGVKRLVVQPRAVVTPAAKDELKARKVELVFENK
jgi:hypothetical protein